MSSEISGGAFILNLDCDMYANNPDAIREALCFFMDDKRGHEIAFVQYPQRFRNITKNDIYASHVHVVPEVYISTCIKVKLLGKSHIKSRVGYELNQT